jgi:hypothetical protein
MAKKNDGTDKASKLVIPEAEAANPQKSLKDLMAERATQFSSAKISIPVKKQDVGEPTNSEVPQGVEEEAREDEDLTGLLKSRLDNRRGYLNDSSSDEDSSGNDSDFEDDYVPPPPSSVVKKVAPAKAAQINPVIPPAPKASNNTSLRAAGLLKSLLQNSNGQKDDRTEPKKLSTQASASVAALFANKGEKLQAAKKHVDNKSIGNVSSEPVVVNPMAPIPLPLADAFDTTESTVTGTLNLASDHPVATGGIIVSKDAPPPPPMENVVASTQSALAESVGDDIEEEKLEDAFPASIPPVANGSVIIGKDAPPPPPIKNVVATTQSTPTTVVDSSTTIRRASPLPPRKQAVPSDDVSEQSIEIHRANTVDHQASLQEREFDQARRQYEAQNQAVVKNDTVPMSASMQYALNEIYSTEKTFLSNMQEFLDILKYIGLRDSIEGQEANFDAIMVPYKILMTIPPFQGSGPNEKPSVAALVSELESSNFETKKRVLREIVLNQKKISDFLVGLGSLESVQENPKAAKFFAGNLTLSEVYPGTGSAARVSLGGYLIQPPQRTARYKLLLDVLEKNWDQTNSVDPLMLKSVSSARDKLESYLIETNNLMHKKEEREAVDPIIGPMIERLNKKLSKRKEELQKLGGSSAPLEKSYQQIIHALEEFIKRLLSSHDLFTALGHLQAAKENHNFSGNTAILIRQYHKEIRLALKIKDLPDEFPVALNNILSESIGHEIKSLFAKNENLRKSFIGKDGIDHKRLQRFIEGFNFISSIDEIRKELEAHGVEDISEGDLKKILNEKTSYRYKKVDHIKQPVDKSQLREKSGVAESAHLEEQKTEVESSHDEIGDIVLEDLQQRVNQIATNKQIQTMRFSILASIKLFGVIKNPDENLKNIKRLDVWKKFNDRYDELDDVHKKLLELTKTLQDERQVKLAEVSSQQDKMKIENHYNEFISQLETFTKSIFNNLADAKEFKLKELQNEISSEKPAELGEVNLPRSPDPTDLNAPPFLSYLTAQKKLGVNIPPKASVENKVDIHIPATPDVHKKSNVAESTISEERKTEVERSHYEIGKIVLEDLQQRINQIATNKQIQTMRFNILASIKLFGVIKNPDESLKNIKRLEVWEKFNDRYDELDDIHEKLLELTKTLQNERQVKLAEVTSQQGKMKIENHYNKSISQLEKLTQSILKNLVDATEFELKELQSERSVLMRSLNTATVEQRTQIKIKIEDLEKQINEISPGLIKPAKEVKSVPPVIVAPDSQLLISAAPHIAAQPLELQAEFLLSFLNKAQLSELAKVSTWKASLKANELQAIEAAMLQLLNPIMQNNEGLGSVPDLETAEVDLDKTENSASDHENDSAAELKSAISDPVMPLVSAAHPHVVIDNLAPTTLYTHRFRNPEKDRTIHVGNYPERRSHNSEADKKYQDMLAKFTQASSENPDWVYLWNIYSKKDRRNTIDATPIDTYLLSSMLQNLEAMYKLPPSKYALTAEKEDYPKIFWESLSKEKKLDIINTAKYHENITEILSALRPEWRADFLALVPTKKLEGMVTQGREMGQYIHKLYHLGLGDYVKTMNPMWIQSTIQSAEDIQNLLQEISAIHHAEVINLFGKKYFQERVYDAEQLSNSITVLSSSAAAIDIDSRIVDTFLQNETDLYIALKSLSIFNREHFMSFLTKEKLETIVNGSHINADLMAGILCLLPEKQFHEIVDFKGDSWLKEILADVTLPKIYANLIKIMPKALQSHVLDIDVITKEQAQNLITNIKNVDEFFERELQLKENHFNLGIASLLTHKQIENIFISIGNDTQKLVNFFNSLPVEFILSDYLNSQIKIADNVRTVNDLVAVLDALHNDNNKQTFLELMSFNALNDVAYDVDKSHDLVKLLRAMPSDKSRNNFLNTTEILTKSFKYINKEGATKSTQIFSIFSDSQLKSMRSFYKILSAFMTQDEFNNLSPAKRKDFLSHFKQKIPGIDLDMIATSSLAGRKVLAVDLDRITSESPDERLKNIRWLASQISNDPLIKEVHLNLGKMSTEEIKILAGAFEARVRKGYPNIENLDLRESDNCSIKTLMQLCSEIQSYTFRGNIFKINIAFSKHELAEISREVEQRETEIVQHSHNAAEPYTTGIEKIQSAVADYEEMKKKFNVDDGIRNQVVLDQVSTKFLKNLTVWVQSKLQPKIVAERKAESVVVPTRPLIILTENSSPDIASPIPIKKEISTDPAVATPILETTKVIPNPVVERPYIGLKASQRNAAILKRIADQRKQQARENMALPLSPESTASSVSSPVSSISSAPSPTSSVDTPSSHHEEKYVESPLSVTNQSVTHTYDTTDVEDNSPANEGQFSFVHADVIELLKELDHEYQGKNGIIQDIVHLELLADLARLYNDPRHEGAKSLIEERLKSIIALDLNGIQSELNSENNLQIAELIATVLRNFRSIVSIRLPYNSFSAKTIQPVADALMDPEINQRIKKLQLSAPSKSDPKSDGISAVIPILETLQNVKQSGTKQEMRVIVFNPYPESSLEIKGTKGFSSPNHKQLTQLQKKYSNVFTYDDKTKEEIKNAEFNQTMETRTNNLFGKSIRGTAVLAPLNPKNKPHK